MRNKNNETERLSKKAGGKSGTDDMTVLRKGSGPFLLAWLLCKQERERPKGGNIILWDER